VRPHATRSRLSYPDRAAGEAILLLSSPAQDAQISNYPYGSDRAGSDQGAVALPYGSRRGGDRSASTTQTSRSLK
jgi:hypothetical protein